MKPKNSSYIQVGECFLYSYIKTCDVHTHVDVQKYALSSVCEVTSQSVKKHYHMIACHKELIAVHLLGLHRDRRGGQCDSEPSRSFSCGWMRHTHEGQM